MYILGKAFDDVEVFKYCRNKSKDICESIYIQNNKNTDIIEDIKEHVNKNIISNIFKSIKTVGLIEYLSNNVINLYVLLIIFILAIISSIRLLYSIKNKFLISIIVIYIIVIYLLCL